MPISNGDILRVALRWLVNGIDEQLNVHTFRVEDIGTTTGDEDFLTQLAAMLLSELYAEVTPQMADNIVGDVLGAFNLTDNEPLTPVAWNADGQANTSDMHALQVTCLVFLNGATPRRQGRVYLPTFAVGSMLDNGTFEAATLADVLSFAAALVLPITDGDIEVRRVISNAGGTSVIVPSNVGFSHAPRTQRRRTLSRGS